jgi:hypothetical protein
MLMVDDYTYARLDFRGDLDFVLPEDAQWGDLGKKYTHFFLFKCFCEFLSYSNVFVLYVHPKTNTKSFVDNTDVGPYRPPGTSPIQWGGEVVAAPQYAKDYQVVEQNLEGLTTDIPDMTLEKVPRHDQCHTVGVSSSMSRLIRRVSREVVCYRERHP